MQKHFIHLFKRVVAFSYKLFIALFEQLYFVFIDCCILY